jgi:hypothetical protein
LAQLVVRIPANKFDIWRLGQLSVQAKETEADNNQPSPAALAALRSASSIADWKFASAAELLEFGAMLLDSETTHASVAVRIWAHASLLNIALVTLSFFAGGFAVTALKHLFAQLACHIKVVLEPGFYAAAAFLLVQSLHYRESVSLGMCLVVVSVGVTAALSLDKTLMWLVFVSLFLWDPCRTIAIRQPLTVSILFCCVI